MKNPGHNAPGKTMMNKTEKSVPNLQNIIKWKLEKRLKKLPKKTHEIVYPIIPAFFPFCILFLVSQFL